MATYIAQLIGPEGIRQTLEFEAANDSAAEQEANDGLDPQRGLDFEYPDQVKDEER